MKTFSELREKNLFLVRHYSGRNDEKMHGVHTNLKSAMNKAKSVSSDAHVAEVKPKPEKSGHHHIVQYHQQDGDKYKVNRKYDEYRIHPKRGLSVGGAD